MRSIVNVCVSVGLLLLAAAACSAQTLTPAVSGITASSFTLSWTTSQKLNTQVHYGVGGLSASLANWTLSTAHSITVTGLTAGTAYEVEAESSDYTNPDLKSAILTVTTTGSSSSSGGSGTTTPPPATGTRLFPAASANWLYSAATGSGVNISSMTKSMQFQVNDHTQGFDYPVQYSTGSGGCVTFTDTEYYDYKDKICVPIPTGGTWAPSVGGYGANDGHLVVVDTANGMYYDFWKLLVNSSGQPTSTNVGQIVSGTLATSNGTPGTTAAEITGLAGDIMPGELNCETCLQHALSVIVPGSMNSNLVGTQAPAVKTDGSTKGAIFREGSKIVFDPTVNVDSLTGVSTGVKAIMKALQQYGGVITDQTGGTQISFYSSLASNPDLTGINQIGAHLFIYY